MIFINNIMKYFCTLIIIFSIIVNPIDTFAKEVVLAGGCFWCLEHDLESLEGVKSVTSGYSGGDLQKPTYENHEGHQEVVLIDYNSEVISLSEIYRLYFRNIDPLDGKGQFCDRGNSYRPVIFFENSDEKNEANQSFISASKELGVPLEKIKVKLKPKRQFWEAEDYHQDFANRNPLKYKFYRYSCGRDQKLDEIWNENARSINAWSE